MSIESNELKLTCKQCGSANVGDRFDGKKFCRDCGAELLQCALCGSYDIATGFDGNVFCRNCGANGAQLTANKTDRSHIEDDKTPKCMNCGSFSVGVKKDNTLFCRDCGADVKSCTACGGYDIAKNKMGQWFCRSCGTSGDILFTAKTEIVTEPVTIVADNKKADLEPQQKSKTPLRSKTSNKTDPEELKCPQCGNVFMKDDSFCGKCGFALQSIKVMPDANKTTESVKGKSANIAKQEPSKKSHKASYFYSIKHLDQIKDVQEAKKIWHKTKLFLFLSFLGKLGLATYNIVRNVIAEEEGVTIYMCSWLFIIPIVYFIIINLRCKGWYKRLDNLTCACGAALGDLEHTTWDVESYGWSDSVTQDHVSSTHYINVKFACECPKCGKQKTFSERLNSGSINVTSTGSSTKMLDDDDVIINYLLNPKP